MLKDFNLLEIFWDYDIIVTIDMPYLGYYPALGLYSAGQSTDFLHKPKDCFVYLLCFLFVGPRAVSSSVCAPLDIDTLTLLDICAPFSRGQLAFRVQPVHLITTHVVATRSANLQKHFYHFLLKVQIYYLVVLEIYHALLW